MGKPLCAQGDMAIGFCNHGMPCCPHTVVGHYLNGASTVMAGGRRVQRMNDTLNTNCPHCGFGMAVTGSGTVLAEGRGITRISDTVVFGAGAGSNVSGNPSVVVGG